MGKTVLQATSLASRVEYIDNFLLTSVKYINNIVDNYSILFMHINIDARDASGTQIFPTAFIKNIPINGSYRIDTGEWASGSAYAGISFNIGHNSSGYYLNPRYAVQEAGEGNIRIILYGIK